MIIPLVNPFRHVLSEAPEEGAELNRRFGDIANSQDEEAAYNATKQGMWDEGKRWLEKTRELMEKSNVLCDQARSVGCEPDTDGFMGELEAVIQELSLKMEEVKKRASAWEAGREEREKAAQEAEEKAKKAREAREAREAEVRAREAGEAKERRRKAKDIKEAGTKARVARETKEAQEAREGENRRGEALREMQAEEETARLAQRAPGEGGSAVLRNGSEDEQSPVAGLKSCSRCAAKDEICITRRENRACDRCRASRQSCSLSSGPRATKYRAVAKSGQDRPTSRSSATANSAQYVVISRRGSHASGSGQRAIKPLLRKRTRFAPDDDDTAGENDDNNGNAEDDDDTHVKDGVASDLGVAIKGTTAAINRLMRVEDDLEAQEEVQVKVVEEMILREKESIAARRAMKEALAATKDAFERMATAWEGHLAQAHRTQFRDHGAGGA